jgi:hypothetical protein
MTPGEWQLAIRGAEFLAEFRRRVGELTEGYDRVIRYGQDAAFYRETEEGVELALLRWDWVEYAVWEEVVVADILGQVA